MLVNIRVTLMNINSAIDETVDLVTPSEEVVDPPAKEESIKALTEEMLEDFARLRFFLPVSVLLKIYISCE